MNRDEVATLISAEVTKQFDAGNHLECLDGSVVRIINGSHYLTPHFINDSFYAPTWRKTDVSPDRCKFLVKVVNDRLVFYSTVLSSALMSRPPTNWYPNRAMFATKYPENQPSSINSWTYERESKTIKAGNGWYIYNKDTSNRGHARTGNEKGQAAKISFEFDKVNRYAIQKTIESSKEIQKSLCMNERNFYMNDENIPSDYRKHTSKCDNIMAEFCMDNPGSLACSCAIPTNIPDDITEDEKIVLTQPECYSGKCKKYGYMTNAQMYQSCPALNVCKQKLKVADGNTLTNVNMKCDMKVNEEVIVGADSAQIISIPQSMETKTLSSESIRALLLEKSTALMKIKHYSKCFHDARVNIYVVKDGVRLNLCNDGDNMFFSGVAEPALIKVVPFNGQNDNFILQLPDGKRVRTQRFDGSRRMLATRSSVYGNEAFPITNSDIEIQTVHDYKPIDDSLFIWKFAFDSDAKTFKMYRQSGKGYKRIPQIPVPVVATDFTSHTAFAVTSRMSVGSVEISSNSKISNAYNLNIDFVKFSTTVLNEVFESNIILQKQACMEEYDGEFITPDFLKGRYSPDSNSCVKTMDTYCSMYPGDVACSCLNMKPEEGDNEQARLIKATPACYNSRCKRYGFKTPAMVEKTCPTINICDQLIQIDGIDNVLTNVNMECNIETKHITTVDPEVKIIYTDIDSNPVGLDEPLNPDELIPKYPGDPGPIDPNDIPDLADPTITELPPYQPPVFDKLPLGPSYGDLPPLPSNPDLPPLPDSVKPVENEPAKVESAATTKNILIGLVVILLIVLVMFPGILGSIFGGLGVSPAVVPVV